MTQRIRVLLLEGPFDSQDVLADANALRTKTLALQGYAYVLIEDGGNCKEPWLFRWDGGSPSASDAA
ncbi:MAG: hypothetical protein ACREP7_16305 [Lysobacter sp.]